MVRIKHALLACILIFSSNVMASEEAYLQVTAPELKRMMAKDPNLLVVHALSRIEYQQQHIPNSINIPTDEMKTTELLPVGKSEPVVFYCMGRHCKYSHNSANIAIKRGYSNVYRFTGGIPEWRKYDYPMVVNKKIEGYQVEKIRAPKAHQLMQDKDIFVLDVRPFFWHGSQNYIKGSINIPLLELDKFLHIIPTDKPIIVNDGFMKQGVSAAKYLGANGFNVLGVVRGGMNRWEKAELPVVHKSQVTYLDLETGELTKGS